MGQGKAEGGVMSECEHDWKSGVAKLRHRDATGEVDMEVELEGRHCLRCGATELAYDDESEVESEVVEAFLATKERRVLRVEGG
jgi:hypothetical protein